MVPSSHDQLSQLERLHLRLDALTEVVNALAANVPKRKPSRFVQFMLQGPVVAILLSASAWMVMGTGRLWFQVESDHDRIGNLVMAFCAITVPIRGELTECQTLMPRH